MSANPADPRSPVQIRAAGRDDLDAIDALEGGAFAADRFARRNLRRLLARPTACVLLAERRGEAAGYVLVLFRAGARVARLYSIAVAGHSRGAGVGAALIEAAVREAARRGADILRLEVRASNEPARRAYRRAAFGETGIRPAYYRDGEDAVIMDKQIGSAGTKRG